MRIVVLADSLALPRNEPPNVVLWEETWPARLQQACDAHGLTAEVINCGARSRRITSLIGHDFHEHIELKRPDVLVLQIGIVDCAPRVISLRERWVMNLRGFPRVLRDAVIRRRSATRADRTRRNPLAKVYTPPREFADSLATFGTRLRRTDADVGVIVLPIVGRLAQLEEHSPGYVSNIGAYNEMLRRFCLEFGHHWLTPENTVPPESQDNCFADDGYHLSPRGNQRVADSVHAELSSLASSATRSTASAAGREAAR